MIFTIVMPSFNSCRTIVSTINSIREQSFSNWELIIVDDGSTDDTRQVVQSEAVLDNRIILIPRPPDRPKGANACRNIGIENAKGDFVAFMDSDDAWKPDRLAKVNYCFMHSECDGLYSGAEICNGDDLILRNSRNIRKDETLIDFILSSGTFAPTPSLVVKTLCAKDIQFDESLQRHQDYDFFIRFGNKYRWVYLDDFQVVVNWTKGSIRNVDFDSCVRFYERHKDDITNKKAELKYLFNMRQNAIESNSAAGAYYSEQIRKLFFQVNLKRKILILFPSILKVQRVLRHLLRSESTFSS